MTKLKRSTDFRLFEDGYLLLFMLLALQYRKNSAGFADDSFPRNLKSTK